MIVVRLQGGLGNQLFQYAMARGMAARSGCAIVLDDSFLRTRRAGVTQRAYELGQYGLAARPANRLERVLLSARTKRPLRPLFEKGVLPSSFTYYREPGFFFDDDVLNVSGDVILEGYWQSEKYFTHVADRLRNEIRAYGGRASHLTSLRECLAADRTAVSLHIRRGDYVSNESNSTFHGVCSLDYYREAVESIQARVGKPTFYVFTDDPDWAKENLWFSHHLVSGSSRFSPQDELDLMSRCSHHIIANSSFSWWGAWLNPSQEKSVISPKRWFASDVETRDLIPDSWIRL